MQQNTLDNSGTRRHKRVTTKAARLRVDPLVQGTLDMKFLLQIFTWWNGQTIGTRFFTWRFGKKVGTDELGNVYFEGPLSTYGLPKRWVIYKDYADASAIPPGWHGWMHHRTNTPPSREDYKPRDWQKPHQVNLTGSAKAYRPKGSIAEGGVRPQVTGDYDAWTPRG